MKQYIDKAALVAEIEKHQAIWDGMDGDYCNGQRLAYSDMISFLNTLEVKEVDLNEEYIEEIYSHIDGIKDTADRMTSGNFMHHRTAIKFSANVIGQVLGLIGLKRQKGE